MGKRGGGVVFISVFICSIMFAYVFRLRERIEAGFSGGHLTGTREALIPEVKADRMTNMNRKWNTMTGS